MKKLLLVLFLSFMFIVLPSCGGTDDEVKVLTYAEYQACELDSEVVIESYVQAKQVWNKDNAQASVYLQDKDGAYFVYGMNCTKDEYDNLKAGTKIRVTGIKAEWSGEIEIAAGSTFKVVEAEPWIATATDVTAKLGTDGLIKEQNKLVSMKNLTIVASKYQEKDADGNVTSEEDRPFTFKKYNEDGSGVEGTDLYFNVSDGKNTYSFTVESDLCGADTDVYQAIKTLNIGDVVNLEGFCYWYNGINPHITKCELVTK